MRTKSEIHTPKRDDEHPHRSDMGVPPGPVTCSAAHTRLVKNIGNAPAPRVFLIGQESVGVLVRLFMVAGFICEEMVLRPANG